MIQALLSKRETSTYSTQIKKEIPLRQDVQGIKVINSTSTKEKKALLFQGEKELTTNVGEQVNIVATHFTMTFTTDSYKQIGETSPTKIWINSFQKK